MKRLFVYGCSHATADFNLKNENESWPRLVANHFNRELYNKAISGNSNDGIFLNILDSDFCNDDLVLVLMTFPHRVMIDENVTVLPSKTSDEWWYKLIMSDVFYQTNFLKCLLAIQNRITNIPHLISFVDPYLLFKYPNHKKIITDDIIFLPKLTLSKSYELGEDKKHMSTKGHLQMSNFLIDKIKDKC